MISLGCDEEALDLWKEIVPEDRIIYGNKKDNFWEMGDQGPCGPCSEIHIDIRSAEEKAKQSRKGTWSMPIIRRWWRSGTWFLSNITEKPMVLWKNFLQNMLIPEWALSVCAWCCKVKQSNYDTDVFTPLIREIETITNNKYGNSEKTDMAIRVIADHVRAVTFSIADGQLPSNTGAGYVIRRILRRAIRYGFTFLDTKEPFIYRLVETLSHQMGEAFPELRSQKNLCENVIREEEQSFLRTLDQGLVLLENIIENTEGKTVSGKKAFELYDTYGFPIDLTALILAGTGI